MSIYKKLTQSDCIITPYTANKRFHTNSQTSGTPYYSSSYYPDYYYLNDISNGGHGIVLFDGTNSTGSFEPSTDTQNNDAYNRLIYNSVKQLYYSNFISSSQEESGSFYNFPQTTINSNIKYFPTASESNIKVLSISRYLTGNRIQPGTFQITGSGYHITDDSEGALFDISSSNSYVGNIVYSHGLAIFTTGSCINIMTASFDLIFKNEYTINEVQYRCLVRDTDFNYTSNPSIATDSSGSLPSYTSASFFSPYVTTVGLYNEANELMAVGKLAQPLPLSSKIDTTIVVKIDM